MIKYLLKLAPKIAIWFIGFWVVCFIISFLTEEAPKQEVSTDYWNNSQPDRIFEIKRFDYETRTIEYRSPDKPTEEILKPTQNYKTKETEIMNGEIDFYEIYDYYAD